MKCPHCNESDHEPGAKFCHNCGKALTVHRTESPKRITHQSFEWAESFSEGLAMVTIDGKTGFVNKQGNIIVDLRFGLMGEYSFGHETHYGFSNGVAVVCIGDYPNRKYGIIDTTGEFVVMPNYDVIWPFSEGMAPFRVNNRWGFISKDCKIAIRSEYKFVNNFSEGLAAVQIGQDNYVYIDKIGRVVLSHTKNVVFSWDEGFPISRPRFRFASTFNDGLAKVECSGQKGYIDKTGKFTKTKFDNIGDFSEGLADFCVGSYRKCGYINKEMKTVIEPRFDAANRFHNGLAVIRMGSKAGYIDQMGRITIPCQFDNASPFHEGMAAIEINKKCGYIDPSGAIVIQPRFESAREFSEGLAAVVENGRWGFIDNSGNYAF